MGFVVVRHQSPVGGNEWRYFPAKQPCLPKYYHYRVSCLALPAGVLVSGAYDGCLRAWSTDAQAAVSVTAGAHEGPITALSSFAVRMAVLCVVYMRGQFVC